MAFTVLMIVFIGAGVILVPAVLFGIFVFFHEPHHKAMPSFCGYCHIAGYKGTCTCQEPCGSARCSRGTS